MDIIVSVFGVLLNYECDFFGWEKFFIEVYGGKFELFFWLCNDKVLCFVIVIGICYMFFILFKIFVD